MMVETIDTLMIALYLVLIFAGFVCAVDYLVTSVMDARRNQLLADLAWLGEYLPEHYHIGRRDIGGRICIGGACGATWVEAVRAGRELHERTHAAYLARQAEKHTQTED